MLLVLESCFEKRCPDTLFKTSQQWAEQRQGKLQRVTAANHE